MKLARYIGNGVVEIVDEPVPELPAGGLIVTTEASGLCSGELMDWYMDRKLPHVLGHEVAGVIAKSDTPEFPVGSRVFVHHHAPCMKCEACAKGHFVHCPTWKATKLRPGGMAEAFAVAPENLADTLLVGDMRAIDAALIEPLACVAKSIRLSGWQPGESCIVIGTGFMGLLHLLALRGLGATSITGIDLDEGRRNYAESLGFTMAAGSEGLTADTVFVCPGVQSALDSAVNMVCPGSRIVLFSPFHPSALPTVNLNRLYFLDAQLIASYSAGPNDTQQAHEWLTKGFLRAEQVVSHFISLNELPTAYQRMKRTEILKPMVVF